MIYFLRNKQPLCKHECMNAWSCSRQVTSALVEVIVFCGELIALPTPQQPVIRLDNCNLSGRDNGGLVIASMWQNFRVVLPLFCGMTPQIFCHELPHNGGDCHLSLNRSKLLSPFVFPLFLAVDRTRGALVTVVILDSSLRSE